MSKLDWLTNGCFKKSASGENLFFPWGVFGSGYVIEADEKHDQIRAILTRTFIPAIIAVFIIHHYAGFLVNLALLPGYYLFYYFLIKKLTAGCPKANERLGLAEAFKNAAPSYNWIVLIFCEVTSVIGLLGCILILFMGPDRLIAVTGIIFCGLCSFAFSYMINVKYNLRDADSP